MKQSELLEQGVKQDDRFDLGKGYCLHLPRGPRGQGDLYHQGTLSKRVNLSDKAERRLLVVELLQRNISQTLLAAALNLSRQTLHNYRESYQAFGLTGLLHGYSPAHSQSQELQGRFHVSQRRPGSKARELEALRRDKKAQTQGTAQNELAWEGEAATRYSLEVPLLEDVRRIEWPATEVSPEECPPDKQSAAEPISTDAAPAQATELPYADTHGGEACRYAGIFPVVLVLASQAPWLQRLVRLYGNGWRLFRVFALMAVRNIRSLEQLKHERQGEAGRILGLGRLPALDTVWSWFHDVADQKRSTVLLKEFFAEQIRCGVVGARLWFTDGHLLPYTGQDKVHAAWSTQRRLPMPGQTHLVTCDDQGRVVYFDIQEGLGDLRAQILKLGAWAREQSLGVPPVHVFDREGNGLGFFSELVCSHTPFITWEKNVDQGRLSALLATDFTHSVSINDTEYRLLEETKPCRYQPDAHPDTGMVEPEHFFYLRRVVVWNQRTDHRTSVLCWDDELALTPETVATGMLSRWGASENTFKQLKARHPYHYRPGFAVSPSTKQDIANPRIKTLAQQISTPQGLLSKCYKKLAKTKPCLNRDGSERNNSQHRRIKWIPESRQYCS